MKLDLEAVKSKIPKPKPKAPRSRDGPVPVPSGSDEVDGLCRRIALAFAKEGACDIDSDSYGRIMLFLMRTGQYGIAEKVSSELGEREWLDLWEAKGRAVMTRTGELMDANDMSALAEMYSHRNLSDAVVRNGSDLIPVISAYLAAHCLTEADVSAVKSKLGSVFPQQDFYRNALEGSRIAGAAEPEPEPESEPMRIKPVPEPELTAAVPAAEPVAHIGSAAAEPTASAASEPEPAAAVPVAVPVPMPEPEQEPEQEPVPEPEQPAAETQILEPEPVVVYIDGMDVTLADEPLGYGSVFKAYRASGARNRPYVVRMLLDEDPSALSHRQVPKSAQDDLAYQEDIWTFLCGKYPDTFLNILDSCQSPYYMQLVEFADATLDTAAATMSVQEKVTAVVTMLDALARIHAEGIVHNDVKVGNMYRVMGKWKLSGFDSSFRAGDEPRGSSALFEYMSPEQYEEKGICDRSDVWSAGVVLYHLLTGKFPFDGRGNQYRNNVMNAQFRERDLDPRYVPLLRRVFSLKPEDRPTAEDMADEIAGILYG